VEVSQESKPSSIDALASRWLEAMDAGRWEFLWLISFVFEVIGRTTCVRDDRKEAIVSDPERERPLEEGGDFESIEALSRYPALPCTL